jgi:hypothetical protein
MTKREHRPGFEFGVRVQFRPPTDGRWLVLMCVVIVLVLGDQPVTEVIAALA